MIFERIYEKHYLKKRQNISNIIKILVFLPGKYTAVEDLIADIISFSNDRIIWISSSVSQFRMQ